MTTTNEMQALLEAQAALNNASTALNQPWSADLVRFLSTGVLSFGSITLIVTTVLLWRSKAAPEHILKVIAILSILSLSAFLLVVGYTNSQLTPIVGLFGAIAGYLLGKESKESPAR